MIVFNHAYLFHDMKLPQILVRKFSRKLLSSSKRLHSRLSARFNLSWLIARCNATSSLAVHRECIARARRACSFQPLLHIEDTQSHIITHRVRSSTMYDAKRMYVASSDCHFQADDFNRRRVSSSRAKCSNHRSNVTICFTLF